MLRMLAAGLAVMAASVPAGAVSDKETDGTPVGQVFDQWLTAFNSGDRDVFRKFYAERLDDPEPQWPWENAQDSCGLTLERIEVQTPLTMTALLREKCLGGSQRVKIELSDADAVRIKDLNLTPLPLPGNGAYTAVADIADRLTARDEFARVMMEVRGNRQIAARSWGLVDRDPAAPMTLDTPMFLASAGKMFTGVAVLQLVDAGKIELDAPLGKYLADYPSADMARVTIRQLLTHRGGTGDMGILARNEGANRATVRSIDDIVKLNGNRGPDFPPGSKEDYSNYGFLLLGAVIERVTGGSYYDYVEENIFKPAGMTNAGFPDLDHLQGVGVGYTTFYGEEPQLVSNTGVLLWRGTPAGGGVASANDMLAFFRAMNAGKLLSPAMFKLATTKGETRWYGMGFVVDRHWGHGGNSYGMDVAVGYFPENDTSFICLATRDMACNRIIFAWHFHWER